MSRFPDGGNNSNNKSEGTSIPQNSSGAATTSSLTVSLSEQQQMELLWRLYCSSLVGSVEHADPIVNDIWQLFYPLLSQLSVYALVSPSGGTLAGPGSMTVGGVTGRRRRGGAAAAAAAALMSNIQDIGPEEVPLTYVFYIDLRGGADSTAATTTATTTSATTVGDEVHGRHAVTQEMRAALQEQPHIVLPLLEFLMAVLCLRRETSTGGGAPSNHNHSSNTNSKCGGNLSSCRVASVLAGRLYCSVLGSVSSPTSFDSLGAAQLGRLVSVSGTIVRLSPSRLACVRLTYRCGLCGAARECAAEDGVLVYPTSCVVRCRGYKWVPLLETAVCEEVQLLKLQEQSDIFDASSSSSPPSAASAAHGEAGAGAMGTGGNKVVEVELRAPLLERATVGDAVSVCGVLGTRRGERKAGCAQQICLYARSILGTRQQLPRMHSAVAVVFDRLSAPLRGGDHPLHGDVSSSNHHPSSNNKDEGRESTDVGGGPSETALLLANAGQSGDDWSPAESGHFYEMARHPQWFARLAASVAPSLFGLEKVKEALLLSVVGGSTQKLGARSSIHLLLVGDPGLGKSQLLRAACAVAPRSSFVCAHTSSTCGLTMTLSRDPVSGEATFEAGAVVHGDGGITCIDEIDKGAAEHKALLEVMEQETVSIAKAGMVFSMPVHTSVLAAGNPVGGKFDMSKPVSANLNLSPALLSRFDIVVCLRDPHTARTGQLTNHVLQLHRNRNGGHAISAAAADGEGEEGRAGRRQGGNQAAGAAAGVLPTPLVRRFIQFCRSQCQPSLCEEAALLLKEHYLAERMRQQKNNNSSGGGGSGSGGGVVVGSSSFSSTHSSTSFGEGPRAGTTTEVPVTPRYLQALIRVSEARAKVELRHEVTREDAAYAVQLLQDCMSSCGDLVGGGHNGTTTDALLSSTVIGSNGRPRKKNQRDMVIDLLKAEVVRSGGTNRLNYNTILTICEEVGCKNPAAMLQQLNEFGVLLQRGDAYVLRGV